MSGRFEFREANGYNPIYEGIDFRQLRLLEVARLGRVAAECWLVVPEDDGTDYEQQITQENTHIELNQVSPHMDRLSIHDERDNTWWVWFRDEMPEEDYDQMLSNLYIFGKVIETMYPEPDVVKMYLKRRLGELALDITKFDEP